MVMSYHPKNPQPEPPHHEGPTTAELFVDAMAARRALDAIKHPRPRELEVGAINMRYCVGSKPEHDPDAPVPFVRRIIFMDGSAAKRNRRGRWVVN